MIGESLPVAIGGKIVSRRDFNECQNPSFFLIRS